MSWRDPTWKYVKSIDTDVRRTFARARAQLEQQRMEYPTAHTDPEKHHAKAHETDARTE